MDNASKFKTDKLVKLTRDLEKSGDIPAKYAAILEEFIGVYGACVEKSSVNIDQQSEIFADYIRDIAKQCKAPYEFSPLHEQLRSPRDYLKFGIEFMRPLIDFNRSKTIIEEGARDIGEKLKRGENVVFFANHQIEADPQVLFSLLGDLHWPLKTIFVAGERVVLDPLAIPFSLGCNLLCIYSKKYIDTPADKRQEKLRHNQKTMAQMGSLLQQGSTSIWVAPSGGRDRSNSDGTITPAPFDAGSVEMFLLMAKKSDKPTNFYPLSLYTYHLLPPPDENHKGLGERREVKRVPVGVHIGNPLDLEALQFPELDRQSARKKRSIEIYQIMKRNYTKLERAITLLD